ncbi:hypothetical protein [Conchiformibius kuhniae]|uniref:Uncharacterized protein n=1 Tax=Conchiformibius kuhniae TaxID=211502 RepID=A0A8T9MW11_9NEIS|nr:hypothetical protein [Conchiformibius kuhniae]UOP04608.1 hypothetical protein LVJ77_10285 [Conchiformibius kuhniae]
MKTKICLLFICLPMLAHAQSCDWRKINFTRHKYQDLILSAPDQPFFPVSDIIVNKQGF